MKTINDFKGTKGELKMDVGFDRNPDDSLSISIYSIDEFGIMATVNGETIEECSANAKLFAASKDLLKELIHLLRLLEPLEQEGKLDVPGLATLNGARKVIDKAL